MGGVGSGKKPGSGTNNPRGNPRGSHNASMTKRENEALDAENSGSAAKRAAVIAGRALRGGN